MTKLLSSSVLALSLAVVGCSGSKTPPPSERVENPAAGTTERPSNLSYGTVKGMVKKNVTTQLELMEMFGGPNIMDTDKDGTTEVWVYNRTSSTTDTAGARQTSDMSAFFGAGGAAGPVVVGGGAAGSKSDQADKRRTVNSVKDLTVIIKFNPDKTVRDYTVRAASF
jgi:hypothetical protein